MYNYLFNKKWLLTAGVVMLTLLNADAQPKEPSTLSNPLAQVLVALMIMLAIAIAILGSVVNSAAALFREKMRKERMESAAKAAVQPLMALAMVAGALLMSMAGLAQDAEAMEAAPKAAANINGLTPLTFYLMISVIAVEIGILIALVYQLKFLVGIEAKTSAALATAHEKVAAKPKKSWWWRLNNANNPEEEEAIDLSHDYDGISELDNKLPPWWIAAFAITILFSVVYMYRYHVSGSAPLQEEELQIALARAEVEKKAYLAKSANNVDESTVVMLDAGGIAKGKAIFDQNCQACHGAAGEGNMVGPNLTDDYWLHGGSLSDIFKTVKYGWPDKGMQSWKEQLSPIQIAQVTSYIKSLVGTNPPNAKEPQGELYKEAEGTEEPTDSTGVALLK